MTRLFVASFGAGRAEPLGPAAGLMLIACISCSPDKPLGLVADPPPPAVVTASPGEVASLVAAVEDARLRILPSFAESTAATELGAALEALAAGFSTGDRNELGDLVLRARGSLERYRSPADAAGAEAADLDAVRLAVELAAVLVLRGAVADAPPQAITQQD